MKALVCPADGHVLCEDDLTAGTVECRHCRRPWTLAEVVVA